MQHLLTHITDDRLPELRVALNRALNTWEDKPEWLVALCDALDADRVYCQNPMMEEPAERDTVAIVTPEFMAKLKPMLDKIQPNILRIEKPRHFDLKPYQRALLDTINKTSYVKPTRPDDEFTKYRVWPDGTVQEACETPHSFMSDDYIEVMACDEDSARNFIKGVRRHA